jgi:hypothetical protein
MDGSILGMKSKSLLYEQEGCAAEVKLPFSSQAGVVWAMEIAAI